MVEITVQLPDDIAKQLADTNGDLTRSALEAIAVEGYRSERLSRGQVRGLLGLSWHENEEFLAKHNCFRHYGLEELEADRKTLESLSTK